MRLCEPQCLPDAVSNVTYNSVPDGTSSSVCSDSEHETLFNSI